MKSSPDRGTRRGLASRAASSALTALLDTAYLAVAGPLLALTLVRRRGGIVFDHLRRRAFRSVPERPGDAPCVWLHGVSVGEVLAARTLVRSMEREFPDWTVVVSASTRAGLESAQLHFPQHLVLSCPLDLSWIVRRAFRRLRPSVFVVVEHDLWPNTLRQASRSGVPVVLVNARLSNRSLRGYRRLSPFYPLRRLLSLICVQDETSALNFRTLGFPTDRVRVTGNLKFDNPVSPAPGIRDELGLSDEDWVLLAGSTHAGEEGAALDAFSRLRERHPRSHLILVPRRPERADEVIELIRERGLSFTLRSHGTSARRDVLLVDTVGELARISAAADVVFVGGSLVPVGGHNVIEPAGLGKPVLLGPHYHNQKSIVTSFLERGAVIVVRSADELATRVLELRENPQRAAELGDKGRSTVEENLGAGQRTFDALKEVLSVRWTSTAKTTRLVLASASQRRQDLLRRLGLPFEVVEATGIDESTVAGSGYFRARELARRKAEWVLAHLGGDSGDVVVLGADTVVVVEQGGEERVLGKPRDATHAREILDVLRGATHRVMTGVALASPNTETRVAVEVSLVTFRSLEEEEIEAYVRSGEPAGKAGAYGIQGEAQGFVVGLRGCYYNVVGLPLRLVADLLGLEALKTCDCADHPLQRGRPRCSAPSSPDS